MIDIAKFPIHPYLYFKVILIYNGLKDNLIYSIIEKYTSNISLIIKVTYEDDSNYNNLKKEIKYIYLDLVKDSDTKMILKNNSVI